MAAAKTHTEQIITSFKLGVKYSFLFAQNLVFRHQNMHTQIVNLSQPYQKGDNTGWKAASKRSWCHSSLFPNSYSSCTSTNWEQLDFVLSKVKHQMTCRMSWLIAVNSKRKFQSKMVRKTGNIKGIKVKRQITRASA